MHFSAQISSVNSKELVLLPRKVSLQFPSRGMAMAQGTVNNISMIMPLEPDGKGSHWFEVNKPLLKKLKAKVGDTVEIEFEPTKDWPEPKIPTDFKKALVADPKAYQTWKKTTPIARWDWIRSIRSTHNPETRKKRIEVACSKLSSGKPRQCCFNRSMCTVPEVAKSGILLDIH
ncbi:YdeI/OmpD-associated family protein [Candidatus Nomurabacteria bacterium]|nr:YdeI/OmpD-associated family protein [Candidatus Nomurabacteria bacterium]